MFGLLELPWWGVVLYALIVTHLTIIGVTLYLHRCMAHRAVELHPVVSHFLRFWLWLTTGMETRQWVAVHRKHHAKVETEEDPHSPMVFGIRKVLLEGAELYRIGARDEALVAKYSHGCPDDWMERNLYRRFNSRGYVLMMAVNLLLLGPIGLTVWAVQMAWIPVMAAGIINGVGHYAGYRKFQTADTSTNIVPVGILIGGEELHNNHHAFASSAKFSVQWYEFDIGWLYLRVLQALGLARVKKLPPKMVMNPSKHEADSDTVSAVLSHRFQVLAQYARNVLEPVHQAEAARMQAIGEGGALFRRARALLRREESMLSEEARARLNAALSQSDTLAQVYEFKRRLADIWNDRMASQESLVTSLQQWCREAEASGIAALQEFARRIPRYSLAAA
jgi:stearoyl-CoA desaturase (delta-9 desaturase)